MSDTLGAIVVGTGFGVLTHLRAMREAGIEVKALVGRDGAKAKKRATRRRPAGRKKVAKRRTRRR